MLFDLLCFSGFWCRVFHLLGDCSDLWRRSHRNIFGRRNRRQRQPWREWRLFARDIYCDVVGRGLGLGIEHHWNDDRDGQQQRRRANQSATRADAHRIHRLTSRTRCVARARRALRSGVGCVFSAAPEGHEYSVRDWRYCNGALCEAMFSTVALVSAIVRITSATETKEPNAKILSSAFACSRADASASATLACSLTEAAGITALICRAILAAVAPRAPVVGATYQWSIRSPTLAATPPMSLSFNMPNTPCVCG